MGRLGFEGLLLFMYSNLFSSRGSFAEYFGFLFDNTSRCYLCLHSFSLLF